MKKRLTHNLTIKMLSVISALILWLIIVNIADPTVQRTLYKIPVEVLNSDAITSINQVYEIVSGDTVDVTVKGKRSIVDQIKNTDLKATANLAELSPVNAAKIDVELIKNNSNNVELNYNNAVLIVSLEDIQKKQFKIETLLEGQPPEGYFQGDVAFTPNIIEISGGKSKISRVDKVAISIVLDGKTSGFKIKLNPVLYDINGDIIDKENLTLSDEQIQVRVTILETKTVPIEIKVIGNPGKGYNLIQKDFKPEKVLIAGNKSDLDKINTLSIEMDITNSNGDIESEILLDDYLPENVILADDMKTLSVRCIIQKEVKKTIDFYTTNITVNNLPEGMGIVYENANQILKTKLTGRKDVLKQLDAVSLGAYIDLDGLSVGTHEVTVKYDLENGIKIEKPYQKVKVQIIEQLQSGVNASETPSSSPEL